MSFTSWLRNVQSAVAPNRMDRKHRRRRSLRAATRRLELEALEDRCLLSTYAVTNLGTLGGYDSAVADINLSGQVVGYATLASGEGHAVLWQDGVATDLGTLGGSYSDARGINASGQVVGYAYLPENSAYHAFLVTPVDSDNDGTPDTWYRDADLNGVNDLMRDLGTLGGSYSSAEGINDSGQVVGYAYLPGDSAYHAFLWNSDAMTDLGSPGSGYSYAYDVNASGQVAGLTTLDNGEVHAVLWQDGVATDLGTLGGSYSEAHGINASGQVAGVAYTEYGSQHAFLAHDGVMQDMGTLPYYWDASQANDINNVGQVVGSATLIEYYSEYQCYTDCYCYYDEYGYYYCDCYEYCDWYTYSVETYHAALWQNGGVKDLNDLVPAGSNTLEQAEAVNDAGQIVANGYGQAYLLTPNSALNSFAISDLPASVTAGDTVSFTVTALSDSGTPLTDYTGTVNFSSSDWQAGLPAAYTFTAADQGAHTFTASLKTAGWQTLSVADETYHGVNGTGYVEVLQDSFLITGPSTASAGDTFTFTVTALSGSGTTLADYTGTVHFTSSDGQAVLPADYTFTTGVGPEYDNGTHTFTVTLKTAGIQSIAASDTVNGTITGSQTGIVVNPGVARTFVVAGFPSSLTTGVAGAFTVTAFDAYDNQATNYTGTVHFASSDGSATLPANYTFAAGDYGVVTLGATLRAVGTQSLTVADTLTPSTTGAQAGIRVIPLASITGPSYAARNQTLTFTLGANGMPVGTVLSYAIDWNGDGIVDQSVSGPSGATVDHAYAASGAYSIGVTATVHIGAQDYTSNVAHQSVTIVAVSVTIQADPGDATKKALVVEGTATAETLVLSPGTGNGVALSINGTSVGAFAAPGGAAFAHLLVYGYGGNDTIQLTGGVTVPAFLFGGDGNDTLDASGSTANNVLVGGAGADALTGGSGRDLLIGGSGADTLRGGGGDDILIGGYTDYDANLPALCAIMKEWGRTAADYNTRVKNLTDGTGSPTTRLNGSYFLTARSVHTVYDDAAIDSLFGEVGLDWFFARKAGNKKDRVNDLSTGETVTAIS